MLSFLGKYTEQAYALMRIITGFLFLFHGAGKLFGLFKDAPSELWTQAWIGGVIELVGGILVMIGFQARLAAFICSGTMAVAYMQFHWKFQFGEAFFPVVNRGELAVLYCFVFLFIACKGAGKWGVERG